MSYNPVKNVDFNSLPNYAIANVPILTYALLGITTLTLGYITIKDKEAENNAESENSNTFIESVIAPTTAIASEVPLEKGGRKLKSKSKSKSKSRTRSKKHL